jgi:hypothetical protein
MKLDIDQMRRLAGRPEDGHQIKLIMNGDPYIFDGTMKVLHRYLNDIAKKWIDMMEHEFKVVMNDGVGTKVSVRQMADIINTAAPKEMDHWIYNLN